jgi:hypothetical protein
MSHIALWLAFLVVIIHSVYCSMGVIMHDWTQACLPPGRIGDKRIRPIGDNLSHSDPKPVDSSLSATLIIPRYYKLRVLSLSVELATDLT